MKLPSYSMQIKLTNGDRVMVGRVPLPTLKAEALKDMTRLVRDGMLSKEMYKLYAIMLKEQITALKHRDNEVYEDQIEEFAEMYRADADVRKDQMRRHRRNPDKYDAPVNIPINRYHHEYKKLQAEKFKLLEAAIAYRKNNTAPTFTPNDIKLARGRRHYEANKAKVLAQCKARRDAKRAEKERLKNEQ